MKILKFDIEKGIFHYKTNDLEVNTHSHPAMEIVYAEEGRFSIETEFGKQENLTFAIIDSNMNHKMKSEQNEIEFLLIECNNKMLKEFLFNSGIKMNNGIFTSSEITNRIGTINDLLNLSENNKLKLTHDKRVYNCIQIMEAENLQYNEVISTLSSRTFISENRLSHLFKENVGISIKRYLLWHRLKYALEILLNEETNLKQASIVSGFYDQPHLSNTFKSFLGVKPSEVFNSVTIQL